MPYVPRVKGHTQTADAKATMIDDLDGSSSTLRLLVWQALKSYPTEALLKLLGDDDFIVRTAVARELQVRGGSEVHAWAMNHASNGSEIERDR